VLIMATEYDTAVEHLTTLAKWDGSAAALLWAST
jgi:hypothetical protein